MPDDRRLVTPPPSPYEPSKGFRLLDEPASRSSDPRCSDHVSTPTRHYVFSDSATHNDDALPTQLSPQR